MMTESAAASQKKLEQLLGQGTGMQMLLDALSEGAVIFRITSAHRHELLYLSEGVAELLGYTRQACQELAEHDAAGMVCREDQRRIRSSVERCAADDTSISETCRVVCADGTHRWVNLSGRRLRLDSDGCPVCYFLMTRLSHETQMYREMLDESTNGVCVCDAKTQKILYANHRMRSVFQMDDEQELYCYQVLAGRESPCEHCNRDRFSNGVYHNHITAAANGRFYEIRSRRFDWYGTPAYISYVSDITEREEEQAKVRERYREAEVKRHILEKNVLALTVLNVTEDRVISCEMRKRGCNELPYVPGETISDAVKKMCQVIPSEKECTQLRETFSKEHLLELMAGGTVSGTVDFRRTISDSRLYWVSNQFNLVKEPETGNLLCYICTVSINEQKLNEQMLTTIVELNYDFILLIDRRTGAPKNFRRDFDLPEKVLIGAEDPEAKRQELLRTICADDDVEDVIRRSNLAAVTSALEKQKTYSVYFTIRENGQIRRKRLIYAYLDDTKHMICCVRCDVTEEYACEQKRNRELSQTLQQLQKADHAKDDFLSRMSHDIRTPLNGIIGMTALSLDCDDPEEIRENLRQIHTSGKYLLSLVNDILDMSKIASRKMELHPEPYTYEEWLQTMSAVVGQQCREKDINFRIVSHGTISPAIYTDKLRFNQIFSNILSNAVKFTPSGGSVTLTSWREYLPDGEYLLRVTVQDTGIGMSQEFLEHALEPFSQEHTAATDNITGTGLGLSIVKSVVDLMGGTMSIHSHPGEGTCVTVELVLQVTAPPVPAEQEKKTRERAMQTLTGRRILLAEDHPVNAAITRKLLGRAGISSDLAENGREAVEKFCVSQKGFYDAILMDIRMPQMDGLEAARTIRESNHADARKIPIIAMTANAFDDDVRKSMDAGMNAHLAKPVEPEKLYAALAEWIGQE